MPASLTARACVRIAGPRVHRKTSTLVGLRTVTETGTRTHRGKPQQQGRWHHSRQIERLRLHAGCRPQVQTVISIHYQSGCDLGSAGLSALVTLHRQINHDGALLVIMPTNRRGRAIGKRGGGSGMPRQAARSLQLAKSAAAAVLRSHGHVHARAAMAAGDDTAMALAAAAAQAHGPPADDGSDVSGDDGDDESSSGEMGAREPSTAGAVSAVQNVLGALAMSDDAPDPGDATAAVPIMASSPAVEDARMTASSTTAPR